MQRKIVTCVDSTPKKRTKRFKQAKHIVNRVATDELAKPSSPPASSARLAVDALFIVADKG